jgi:AcrR family transcriptional regulator
MTDTDREPLTPGRILDAAIDLADEQGIEALSMRRLAAALGVEAMSIYHHIPNKGALVDAMADRIFGEIELPDDEADWRQAVRKCAESAHRQLMAHPWASSLVMSPSSPGPQPARTRYIDWLLRLLADAGLSPKLAYRGYHAIDAHILGFTAWHLGHSSGLKTVLAGRDLKELVDEFIAAEGADLPHLADHARLHLEYAPGDGYRDFLFGLGLVLDGLERARMGSGAPT